MTSTALVAAGVMLLSLGVASLVLAYVAWSHSVRGGGRRALALAALGVASLAGMVMALSSGGWSSARGDVLGPLAVYLAAALCGAGLAAWLLYVLVAAR